MVTVPNVRGMTQADAQSAITGAALVAGSVTEEYIDIQPAGHVFRKNPLPGTSVHSDTPEGGAGRSFIVAKYTMIQQ
jgi:beta-lactam-binding protein with PASTA domain